MKHLKFKNITEDTNVTISGILVSGGQFALDPNEEATFPENEIIQDYQPILKLFEGSIVQEFVEPKEKKETKKNQNAPVEQAPEKKDDKTPPPPAPELKDSEKKDENSTESKQS